MKERASNSETITERMVLESLIKDQANIVQWRKFLIQNTDPEHPLVNFARSVIKYSESQEKLIQKRGITKIALNLSSAVRTMRAIPDKTPLSEAARIITNKYPEISQLHGIIEHIPNGSGILLDEACFLVLNYQTDPNCYDNYGTYYESLKKGGGD